MPEKGDLVGDGQLDGERPQFLLVRGLFEQRRTGQVRPDVGAAECFGEGAQEDVLALPPLQATEHADRPDLGPHVRLGDPVAQAARTLQYRPPHAGGQPVGG